MRMTGCYIRTGFKTGCGLRKGGFVGASAHPRVFCGYGIRKSGPKAGTIYKKYR